MIIYRIAVDAPLAALFDYLPPAEASDAPPLPGSRVLVLFGHRQEVGILIQIVDETDQDTTKLKAVERLLDPGPLLSAQDLQFIRWAADYYQQPLGEALFTALPARLRKASPLLDDREPGARPTALGRATQLEDLNRAPKQRAMLALLQTAPDGLSLTQLRDRLGDCSPTLRALRTKGMVADCNLERGERAAKDILPSQQPPYPLTEEQSQANSSVLAAFGRFQAFLLDGITGSGKTEVYIRLIQELIEQGRQALVLVPEIGLTPQLRERFSRRIPGPIAVLHSARSATERERDWHRAARGEATLLLGTRSAIFAPLPRLGLIVVDEEHDPSLKQQEGFRYSARDLAVRRAQLVGCPVVLGTATPSLETLHNARLGRYTWLRLTHRTGQARPPRISLLDIRRQPLRAGLSKVLRTHMQAEISAGNQVLLFLNRRGYAPVFTCHSCGWVGGCRHCDARLTLHLAQKRLWCHHCDWSQPLPTRCPECQGLDLRMLGQGTERLEDELRPLFPGVTMARIDRDSTRRKGELARLFDAAQKGEIQILLGTQMLAKGHDFPGVTLVGILDLDQSLYASDFRAPERTAQLMVQVAGRAGRADRPGRVVIQTRHPEHPLLQSLLQEGYGGFAALELTERRAAELPPFAHLALARADAPEEAPALDFLRQARELGEALGEPRVQLLGPVPAPMQRRAGRHRAQLLLQSQDRPLLQRFLQQWTSALRQLPRRRGLRWSLDVDPQDML
ncbi:primosomal protein N' [Thiorhodococcus mannitoliphagus]|uniref:Replication restart protein PriA n=1 Tax=Thiorhodococcus mannitoliphagus TaxID=329406 RepID=A0A6P1DZ77_9GAMM|nr:primosomal protein N' [Thiorhodococcus mannitoliphagus]NEX22989.1 primosomal protein N' [Thiorhodococcus mannitoliphagus]